MPNGLANIRGIEEEERKRQATPPPVTPDAQAGSLPFRIGRGLRRVGAEVIAPAATSIYDVASLPTRAVKFGIGEAISGAIGDRPPQRFERAPATTALSRMVQPSPVEIEQATGQGIRGFAGAAAAPPTPGRELLPEERPAAGLAARPTAPAPVFGPAAPPPSEAAITQGLRGEPAGPTAPPIAGARTADELRGIRLGELYESGQIGPGVFRSVSTDPETGEPFTQTFIQGGSELFSPAERMEMLGLPGPEVQEKIAEGESRRGLRAAQTVAAERAAETAKLVRTNIEVPTGGVNELTGEPLMTKRQVLYNPETEEFIDPLAPRRAEDRTAAEARPAVTLREEYDKLSEEDRSVVEKHFSGREDVTPDEVLSYIQTLRR